MYDIYFIYMESYTKKIMMGISTSTQNGVTEIKFTLLPETAQRQDTIYESMVVKTIGISQ